MPTILITGGTGLIGKALCKVLLSKGYDIIILTRSKNKYTNASINGISYAEWDVKNQRIDTSSIEKADYIINLAGAGVADKRWTKERKQEILSSRVNGCKLIADSLRSIPNKVKAVISSSAIGWYGPDPTIPNPHPFTEKDMPDESFLGNTCKQWEESIAPVTKSGIRLVLLRTGIVLSKEGGALKEFLKPLKFAIAAILGNGKQIISWIHIDDLVALYLYAIENDTMNRAYNAVAPQPVSNKELTIQLAKAKNKFYIPFYVPSVVLKIVLGEMSIEVLKSCTVNCDKIISANFNFKFPDIRIALNSI